MFHRDNGLGSVEICSTGWNSKEQRIVPESPEELEEPIQKVETDIDSVKKAINEINKCKLKPEKDPKTKA